MLEAITLECLSEVVGGEGNSAAERWSQIREAAAPHCPQTVASHPNTPRTRTQAQAIGNACIAEMGSFKAAMGGRSRIQAGIDEAFPR